MGTQNSTFTKDYLHKLFEYRDGSLYWKKNPSKNYRLDGTQVGNSSQVSKYIQVSINKKKYYVHRIIFMMFNGFMPAYIDHIDGNRKNNKIENLRNATLSENQYNKIKPKHNTSGVKGVYFHKRSQKWMARCGFNKKCYFVGSYKNFKEAETAITDFRSKLHGEFARYA
jgi:hypothetical protein